MDLVKMSIIQFLLQSAGELLTGEKNELFKVQFTFDF